MPYNRSVDSDTFTLERTQTAARRSRLRRCSEPPSLLAHRRLWNSRPLLPLFRPRRYPCAVGTEAAPAHGRAVETDVIAVRGCAAPGPGRRSPRRQISTEASWNAWPAVICE